MRSVIRDSSFQSRQMGRRDNKIVNIEGRVTFDLLQVSSTFGILVFVFCEGIECSIAETFPVSQVLTFDIPVAHLSVPLPWLILV